MPYHHYFRMIVIAVTALTVFASGLARPAAARWEPPDGTFPIVAFYNPAPERYPEMRQAGFTVTYFRGKMSSYDNVVAGDVAGALDVVHHLGMHAFAGVGLSERSDSKEATQAAIRALRDHPAVIGYELKDEPHASMFERLADIKRWGSEVDPEALYFVNLLPNYANRDQLGTDTYQEHVEQYMQVFQPKVLCFDHYPLHGKTGYYKGYYQNLEIIRAAALKYDVPFWAFVNVTPSGFLRDPSEAEVRFQIFSDLGYGAQGLFYFCYRQPNWQEFFSGVVDPQSNPTHHYPQVKRINAMVHAWGPTLLKLRSTGVYHVGELPPGTKPLPPDGLIKSVSPPEQLIVGLFAHTEGGQYIMLMNKDYGTVRRFVIKFAPALTTLEEVSRRTGELMAPTPVAVTGSELCIAAGGARLFKVSE